MNKRIFFIILGALLLLVLIFVLWFWFFGRHNKTDILPNTGTLGAGQNTNNSGNGSGGNGNDQAPYGTNTSNSNDTNRGVDIGDTGESSSAQVTFITSSSTFSIVPAGVSWVNGSYNISGGGGFNFDPSDINNVSGGSVSGSPYITKVKGADGKEISLTAAGYAVALLGCALNYTVQRGAIAPVTTVVGNVAGGIGNFLASLFGINVAGSTPLNPQYVSDIGEQSNSSSDTVVACIARSIGRVAVQQITDSTVSWINSGFDGKPAYVQDFGQFFDDVADKSAGEFIKGSDLAFLCSPFQLQVKIAIAQSYANRKSSSAGSCTLTGVVNNVENFINGSFSDGGWPAFLRFTTVPANNPFAGYVDGQLKLNQAINWDQQNATLTISPGGFLSRTETYDCRTVKDTDGTVSKECKTRIVTPGSVLDSAVQTSFQGQLDSLQLGDSLDQILNALANQLMTKVLYGGLANANKSSNDPTDKKATTKAQELMDAIQINVSAAQQYAGVKQRVITDIQTSQQNLATLANCWSVLASSTLSTSATQVQALTGFTDTVSLITLLQSQVEQLNSQITAANNSITKLWDMQTNLLLATAAKDVADIEILYKSLNNTTVPRLYIDADVTTAQQDRQTVQNQLAGIQQSTGTQLDQCHALR